MTPVNGPFDKLVIYVNISVHLASIAAGSSVGVAATVAVSVGTLSTVAVFVAVCSEPATGLLGVAGPFSFAGAEQLVKNIPIAAMMRSKKIFRFIYPSLGFLSCRIVLGNVP